MVRNITDLEQKLLEKGFYLESKTYTGKHSQTIKNYIYIGEICCHFDDYTNVPIRVKVGLTSKRDNIDYIRVFNTTYYKEYVSFDTVQLLSRISLYCKNEILRLVEEGDELSSEEEVALVEALEEHESRI